MNAALRSQLAGDASTHDQRPRGHQARHPGDAGLAALWPTDRDVVDVTRPEHTPITRARSEQGSRGRAERPDVVRDAVVTFLEGARIEMRQLATVHQLGRSTLYRWFGDRDGLLGDVIWALLCPALSWSRSRATSQVGPARLVSMTTDLAEALAATDALATFLEQEPEAATRVLLGPAGTVHDRLVEWFTARIREEQQAGSIAVERPAGDLAEVLVTLLLHAVVVGRLSGRDFDRARLRRGVRAAAGVTNR